MARPGFDQGDVRENRVKGGLGYLIFFLPLILCPGSKFGRYCANQGLAVLIAYLLIRLAGWILGLLLGWVPLLGWALNLVFSLAEVAVGVFAIYLTYLACAKGDAREIPYIGSYTIIK